jgi:hypothetical protein
VSSAAIAAMILGTAEEARPLELALLGAAAIRGLNATIVGWTLTNDCVLAVWRRSG